LKRSFSIITVCKGRLEHLKQSLPRMIEQANSEVIVVDYSCPDKTGDYVEKHFPAVRVVRVEGERVFSNWKGRNRGAAIASGDMLLFCDADTILTENAAEVISRSVPEKAFGFFTRKSTAHFNKSGLRLEMNQLRGFQAVPAAAFKGLGGYDELLAGYAAGGDTDLEERLVLFGLKATGLGDGIIDDVVQHDNVARFTFHRDPIRISYAAGMLYRRAKILLLKASKTGLPLADRERIYAIARKAANRLTMGENVAKMHLNVEDAPIGMPRQLGFARGRCRVLITVQLVLHDKIDLPSD
jgi:glycosyltransferase involved in cell wall biosynthesis